MLRLNVLAGKFPSFASNPIQIQPMLRLNPNVYTINRDELNIQIQPMLRLN